MVRFEPVEMPIAYSMIAAAMELEGQNDNHHPYHKFFYYWTAFNNIYTTIAYTGNHLTTLKTNRDGTIKMTANGEVRIPAVNTVGERKQIELAFIEFDDDLKHSLILNDSTRFFANRTPSWQDEKIVTDDLGQKLNGVLNVNHTVDIHHPVWSPIDRQLYSAYLADPVNSQARDFLAKQIVDLLYTVRCNLLHGGKKFDDRNDVTVVENALPLLAMIVSAFIR